MIILILKGRVLTQFIPRWKCIFRHSICLVVPPGSESILEPRADGDVITDFDIRERSLLDSGELKRSIYYFKAEANHFVESEDYRYIQVSEDFIRKNFSSFKMTTFNTPYGRALMKIADELYRNALTNRNR